MFVSHKALNVRHLTMTFYGWGEERKRRRLEEEEAQAGADAAITACGIPLAPVASFKYPRRFLLASENDWPAVVIKLRRARHKWARMTGVLIGEGADAWN